jgi:putative glycosyltransferase (TIGR04348 family)
MIALHAARSHDSIHAWKTSTTLHRPLVLIMTGTDLYRDLPAGSLPALDALARADSIVVLQPEALNMIPAQYLAHSRVIFQSVLAGRKIFKRSNCFLVTVIGHLRAEKDPFCINQALQYLPASSLIRVVHLGAAMSSDFALQAQEYGAQDARYRWIGPRTHRNAMRWLASCHLMVISSVMEGGAHVVSEAIALGIAVIASDIDGNRGLLGDDYPGLYPVSNSQALAALLQRAETDPDYLHTLESAVRTRQLLITPAREQQSIASMLADIQATQTRA